MVGEFMCFNVKNKINKINKLVNFKMTTTTPQQKIASLDEKLLIDAGLGILDIQSSLNDNEALDFIKLLRNIPNGARPRSKSDVDNLTSYLYKNIPTNWQNDLKLKTKKSLNDIRTVVGLPQIKETNYTIIIILFCILLFSIALLIYILSRR
jgi:hypothetical protein